MSPLRSFQNAATASGRKSRHNNTSRTIEKLWRKTNGNKQIIADWSGASVATRDPLLWPFASDSIWNMPIGSGAIYLPLSLTPPTTAYGTDEVYLQVSTTAPLRSLIDRDYWWPWTSGTSVPGTDTGVQVRVADDWIIPPPEPSDMPNRATWALQADGLAREFQYTVRPTNGSNISIHENPRAVYDLTGNGLTGSLNGNNGFGAHGGAGMTCIGGTIRAGELSSTDPIRHALAVTLNMRKWGTKQGGNITDGYRWPAISADSYWDQNGSWTGYGTGDSGSGKDGLGMGSLLAIPANVDLSTLGFETSQGLKIARAHQDFGAYVVDDSQDGGSWDVHRLNVEISVLDEFPALDTYPGTNTPFGRDMNKIFTRLAVVDNNTPSTIGGGGTPRVALAPALGTPGGGGTSPSNGGMVAPPQGSAAIVRSVSGHTGTDTTPTSVTVDAGAITSASNTLLLTIASDLPIATPSGWTLDRPQVNNTGHYLFRRSGGAQTYTIPVSAQTCWHIQEVSGLSGAAPAVNSDGTAAAVTTQSTGSITPTTSGAFIVASFSSSKSETDTRTWTFNNSFTQVGTQTQTQNTTGYTIGLATASKSVTTMSAESCTGTYSAPWPQTGIIAAYPVATS